MTSAPGTPAASEVVLDEEHLLAAVGGNRQFVDELASLFDEDGEALVAQLLDGRARADAVTIAAGAHRLSGTAGSLGGKRTAQLAGALEARARAGDLAGAAEAIDSLRAEVAKLRAALHALVAREP